MPSDAPPLAKTIDSDTLPERSRDGRLRIVMFGSVWSKACQMARPRFERMLSACKELPLEGFWADVDLAEGLTSEWAVIAVPTQLYFAVQESGEWRLVHRFCGLWSVSRYYDEAKYAAERAGKMVPMGD